MPHRFAWLVAVLISFAVVASSVAGDVPKTPKKNETKPAPAKQATVKVEKGPLTVALVLKGVVQGTDAAELSIRTKSWGGPFVVSKAVEHGAPVKAGDVLVEIDSEKLDHLIRDAREERSLAGVAIRQAELEMPLLEKQATLDLAAAERAQQQAAEDLKHFLTVVRPEAEKDVAFRLKMGDFFVAQAKDQLKQLQKMYKDKDLTEETEQVILKRYQFAVEMEEYFFKSSRLQGEHILKVDLPRRELAAKENATRTELALVKARDLQPLQLKHKQLTLAKLTFEEQRAKDRLAELEKDKAALTVRAPADGIAYHGRVFRGQWIVPQAPQQNSLLPGSMVMPNDVFLTIVPRGKLVVRADVEEKELSGLTAGLAGMLTPTAFPDDKIAAKIGKVATIPLGGKFEVVIEPDAKSASSLSPGMTGSCRFVTYRKADALTVPATAVFEDTAEDTHYVYRPGTNPEKHLVRVGRRSGDRLEILSGLSAGDEILAAKP